MGLHIVTGYANAGKTGVVYAALRDAASRRGTGVLLLPSGPDVARARLELGSDWPLGLKIQSFDAYLNELWRLYGDGRAIVTTVQRSLLLEDALQQAAAPVLSAITGRIGLVSTLSQLVRHVAEQGVEVVEPTGSDTGAELLRIVAAYERLLAEHGLVEQGAAHFRLPAVLDENVLPDIIAINRFSNLSPGQELFVRSAAARREIWLTLNWVQDFPATADANALVSRLSELGSLEPVSGGGFSRDPEIRRLETALFSDKTNEEHVPACGALILSEASGTGMQAARIVAEIQDALDVGIPADQIAVVYRDLAQNLLSIKAALSDAGITASYDVVTPLSESGLGRSLLLLLSCFVGGSTPRDLFGFLKTPYSGASPLDLDRLDAQVRRNRAVDIHEAMRSVKRAKTGAAPILATIGNLCSGESVSLDQTAWVNLLGTMMRSAYGTGCTLESEGETDAAAAAKVLSVVRDIVSLAPRTVTVSDLSDLLRTCTVALSAEEAPGRIQVMSAQRVRGRRFSCVIVGGVEQGAFGATSTPDVFSAPQIERRLAEAGIAPWPHTEADAERLLYYEVLTRARERLVLSRRVIDDEARTVRPSSLLEETLDLYRNPTTRDWYCGEVPTHTLGAAGFGCAGDSPQTLRRQLRDHALAASHEAERSETSERLAHARWRARPHERSVSASVVTQLSERKVFTASEIETYLQCPYRWYVDRVLKPSSLDDELDAAERGRAAHSIMAMFHQRFLEQTDYLRVEPENLEEALRVHAEVAREIADGIEATNFSEQAEVRRITALTARVVTEDASLLKGFEPRLFEWRFGLDDGDEPEPFDGFSLRGVVDRIDSGPAGLVVTDYKTGSIANHQADKFSEFGLVQLPLYAEVVRRRLEPFTIAGAFYRSVGSPNKPRGFWRIDAIGDPGTLTGTDKREAEDIRLLVDDAVARAGEAVAGMRAGVIAPRPLMDSCPAYCSAIAYCKERR